LIVRVAAAARMAGQRKVASLWQTGARMTTAATRAVPRQQQMRQLPRRQYHHHLTAFEAGLLLYFGDFQRVVLDAIEQLITKLLVRHLAPAEAQGHLDLIAVLEEPLHGSHFHVVVVIVDHWAELDLLHLDDLLLLASLSRLLLRLVFVFAVVEDLANRRV
jgi:hypothetical protein